jgi:hypothetical protein
MSHGWQEMLAWVAGVVVPLLVLATVFITVLELERMHHFARVSQTGVNKAGGIDTAKLTSCDVLNRTLTS